jgi:serine/threonine protein kinase
MDEARLRRVESIFHAAVARPAAERESYLDEACAGDAELRREIASLLAHEPGAEALLRTPMPDGDAATISHETSTIDGEIAVDAPEAERRPTIIGPYRIVDKLGEGGMGVVYVATDTRLGRRVALKVLRGDADDPGAKRRLVREARVAAGLSHPLICQVFELGEWNSQPFIAMELVEGEPLASRLQGGALAPMEALRLTRLVVEALGVLHEHGVVHRDLKPSNIFVTRTGIKVLDFGLARPFDVPAGDTIADVTRAGTIVGTPQYAAPEQLTGGQVDARADLFSAGVMLFEMLTGRRLFGGRTVAAVVHAVLYETPPALTGSAAVVAIDRVLRRALAKDPARRYADAAAFAADLQTTASLVDGGERAEIRPIVRLAVIPFRMLNPDRDIDHLGASFADALAGALASLESLVVRSTLASARFAHQPADLGAIADALSVDFVLTGSILRRGQELRIHAELLSVPSGDVWLTHSTTVEIGAIFGVHEDLAERVRKSLPLAPADRRSRPSVQPASTKAYDLYLRGMQLRMESSSWRQARSYFDRCLALDPEFAPAWAERGRLDRILAKFEDASLVGRAEAALAKALERDPDNGAARLYLAQLEIDLGRAHAVLVRLTERARERRAEPQTYSALVHACRYNGLLAASLAADEHARHLDPSVSTSVLHTFYMAGDYARALDEADRTSDPFESRVLGAIGRDAEAIEAARREEERFASVPRLQSFSTAFRAALEGKISEALAALEQVEGWRLQDGEGLFYVAAIYTRIGEADRARQSLERSVDAGFVCLEAFDRDPYLSPVRTAGWWRPLRERVRLAHEAARAAFDAAGGPAALGLGVTRD